MHKSPGIEQRVLLENADVRVSRIAIPPGATWVPDSPRLKRVIIWITGSHTERHALELHSNQKLSADRGEIAEREAGNAVFRTPSKHSITNHGTETQISVIVELKK